VQECRSTRSGNVRRLTSTRGGSYSPAWPPDGKLIAFNSQRDGNSELYVMRWDGSNQRRLTHHPQEDGFVAWIGRLHQRTGEGPAVIPSKASSAEFFLPFEGDVSNPLYASDLVGEDVGRCGCGQVHRHDNETVTVVVQGEIE
jgi:dipeptidyl aminopeptidase/acylaminoacyl peptidase